MNEAQYRKQLLLERIRSNREFVRLEMRTLRHRVGSITRVFDVGKQLLQPLGAMAGVAAASVARKPGTAGGLVGLAALVPVVLTVAKLVSVASGAKRDKKAAAGSEAQDDVADAEGDVTGEQESQG